MNAHHVLDLVVVYRELTLAEQRRVQDHVAGCAPCALALAQAQRVDARLQFLPPLRHTPAQDVALRHRVQASRPAVPRATIGWLRRPQMAWLIVVFVITTLLGSTGAAAAHSLPDTPLYPLKLAGEQARGWLIWDATAQAEWQLARARARLDEINRLLAQGRLPSRQTLTRLQEQLASALDSTARTRLPDTVRLLQQAGGLTGDALANLSGWPQQAPALAPDDLEDLRHSLRQQQRAIDAGLAAPEKFRQPAAPTPAATQVQRALATATPTFTPTDEPTATSAASTSTPLPAPTHTATPAATATASPTPAATGTPTAPPTATPTPSATPTARPRIFPPRPSTTPSGTPRPRRTPPPPAPPHTATPDGTTPGPTPTAMPTGGHILPPVATRTALPPRPPRLPPPGWTPRWTPRATQTPAATDTVTVGDTPTPTPPATPTAAQRPTRAVTPAETGSPPPMPSPWPRPDPTRWH